MSIKTALNNPKLWQALTTVLLSYFGYVQVEQVMQAPSVDVDFVMPAQEAPAPLAPVARPLPAKDWAPIIRKICDERIYKHNDEHHGGN